MLYNTAILSAALFSLHSVICTSTVELDSKTTVQVDIGTVHRVCGVAHRGAVANEGWAYRRQHGQQDC